MRFNKDPDKMESCLSGVSHLDYQHARGDNTERYHTILSRITELTLELSDLKLELSRLEKNAKAKNHRADRFRDSGSGDARGSLSELEEGSERMRRELIRMRADIEEKRRNNEILLREIARMKENLKTKPRTISGYDVAGDANYGNYDTAVSDWPNVTTHDNSKIGESNSSSFPKPFRLTKSVTPTKLYSSVNGNYRAQSNFAESTSYLADKFRKTTSLMYATPKFRLSDYDFAQSTGQRKEVYRPSLSTLEGRAFRQNHTSYPIRHDYRSYPIQN